MQQDAHTELERFHNDGLWFSDHYNELLEEYPDHWVAIYHKEVVGTSPNPDELLADLNNRAIPINDVFFKFMSSVEVDWAFPSVS